MRTPNVFNAFVAKKDSGCLKVNVKPGVLIHIPPKESERQSPMKFGVGILFTI